MDVLPIPPVEAHLPRSSDARPLLEEHEIISLPSASALAVMREVAAGRPRASRLLAVLADPVFDAADTRLTGRPERAQPGEGPTLRRLVHSRREAEAILGLAGPGFFP